MTTGSCLQPTLDGGVLMMIEVQPGAHRDRLLGVNQWRSRLGVAVQAQAQKGLANKAVITYLCEVFSQPTSSCSIVNGHTSRSKTVRFENLEHAELLNTLNRMLEGQ